jgi:periplasmic protein TonB
MSTSSTRSRTLRFNLSFAVSILLHIALGALYFSRSSPQQSAQIEPLQAVIVSARSSPIEPPARSPERIDTPSEVASARPENAKPKRSASPTAAVPKSSPSSSQSETPTAPAVEAEPPTRLASTAAASAISGSPAPSQAKATTRAIVNLDGCVKPSYPPTSLRAGEEGLVVLEFLIAADGGLKDSKIVSSSGYRRLDLAAKKALTLCRFFPATENGQPVEGWAGIEYQWRISPQ